MESRKRYYDYSKSKISGTALFELSVKRETQKVGGRRKGNLGNLGEKFGGTRRGNKLRGKVKEESRGGN